MLDSFRKISRTWFGKILGAFLIVGLAGFGISNVIFDIGSNTVAQVGDEEITTIEFQRAYSNQLNQFAQQTGQMPSPEDAIAMGIPSVVLSRLAADAAINQFSREMGIGVSDDRLGQMLRQDPSFSGTLGQFERANFLRVLQQSGLTESDYFELQTEAARRQQLVAGLFAGSTAPDAAQQLMTRYGGDTRTLDYFVVNAQAIEPVAAPTGEELATYLAEHQAEFRTEETRSVDVMALSPEALATTITIDDAAVAAEYERTLASRSRAERRHILQVPLATEELAAAFVDGRAAGRSFDELVAETGVTPIDLGTLAASEVTDPTLAEAAFALEQGDFVIIQGVGGERAVTVSAIEPGGVATLAEASDEIRQALALAQARNQYVEVLDQIEELRAAFQPLEEIAERFGLTVHPVTVTAGGEQLAEVEVIPETERARVATAIFAAEADRLEPTISLGSNRNIWFDLKAVEPARDQTLDEVRDEITAALVAERTEAAVIGETEEILARLEAGDAFADIAASRNTFPILSQPLGRSGDGTSVLNEEVAAAAFAGGPNHFGSARNGDGDYVVFQVVDVVPATAETSAQVQGFIAGAVRETLYSAFVSGLRDAAGIRINRQTFDQLISLDSATGQ